MVFPEALSSFMRLWIARKGNPTCRSNSSRRGEAEAKMSGFDRLIGEKSIALCQNTDDNCSGCFGGCLKVVRLFILLMDHKLVAYSPYFFKNSRSCGPGNSKKLHFFKEKESACWISGLDGTIFAEPMASVNVFPQDIQDREKPDRKNAGELFCAHFQYRYAQDGPMQTERMCSWQHSLER